MKAVEPLLVGKGLIPTGGVGNEQALNEASMSRWRSPWRRVSCKPAETPVQGAEHQNRSSHAAESATAAV